jgi:hypothetical protein
MSNVSIFKEGGAVAPRTRELSALAKSLVSASTSRRIAVNINGTFKRMVNGEQIGKSLRGEIDLIIVAALPKVSRTYYEGNYDPDAKPTLPDCWSNLGDKPEAAASNKQASNCADCPMNAAGSGTGGKGRACRFQRRVAALVAGDPTGEIYQFNIPAKSLFGKGVGNIHPFESYVKFLAAHNLSPDGVVTNVKFNDEVEGMELLFSPVRETNDDEYEMVTAAQANPEAKSYTMLTVAQADGVTKKPALTGITNQELADLTQRISQGKGRVAPSDEPDDEDEPQPVKRASKAQASEDKPAKKPLASLVSEWGEDE